MKIDSLDIKQNVNITYKIVIRNVFLPILSLFAGFGAILSFQVK